MTRLGVSLGAVLLAGLGHISLYFWLRHANKERKVLSAEEREQWVRDGRDGDFHPDYR